MFCTRRRSAGHQPRLGGTMRQIDSLRESPRFQSVLERASRKLENSLSEGGLHGVIVPSDGRISLPKVDALVESLAARNGSQPVELRGAQAGIEAIILAEMRPAYFVINDEIIVEGDYDELDALVERKELLERKARNVGRVDLLHHATHEFVGTGWLVEQDIIVTNRHVAEMFAQAELNGGYTFRPGVDSQTLDVMMDYVRQHKSDLPPRRAFATEVIYVAGSREPDLAFIRVQTVDDTEPLELSSKLGKKDQPVVAVGYPAWDGNRNDARLMAELFGGVYNVKRVSPGKITGLEQDGVILLSDYTSLGGNSGSPVLDIATGKVVGLHFAGAFRQSNYAVSADIVASALRRTKISAAVSSILAKETAVSPVRFFEDRKGYNPQFLGEGELAVPLPEAEKWQDDLAPVNGGPAVELRYEHFSVIQSKSRRLPLFTAVNIDGERQRKLDREGEWKLDARLLPEHQIGNELYRSNRLDRGHMVRRRDPGWGDGDEARRGEADTFHYTNSVPQHENLNQKEWLRLEDYLLEAVETLGFKATVFTGPVFRSTDKNLRRQPGASDIKIPEEFWKVAVMINAETGKLHATAYVLSHGAMIRNMTEAEFLFGKHETFQVPLKFVERATGLSFGTLCDCDPLRDAAEETLFSRVAQRITDARDLLL